MPETICFVDACYVSPDRRARAARKLAGKPVLEWIVRAATEAQRIDAVVVVTSEDPKNDFVDRLVPPDIPLYRGPGNRPLDCFVAAVERFQPEAAVRLLGICPFVDSTFLDLLVGAAERCGEVDYVAYCDHGGRPAILGSTGPWAEWYRTITLSRMVRRLGPHAPVDPTEFVLRHISSLRVHLIPRPKELEVDVFPFALDSEEDWEFTEMVFEFLGPDACNFRRVMHLLGVRASSSVGRHSTGVNRAAG
jgi:spore coat polysaccharide biosynthesis protein SpsF